MFSAVLQTTLDWWTTRNNAVQLSKQPLRWPKWSAYEVLRDFLPHAVYSFPKAPILIQKNTTTEEEGSSTKSGEQRTHITKQYSCSNTVLRANFSYWESSFTNSDFRPPSQVWEPGTTHSGCRARAQSITSACKQDRSCCPPAPLCHAVSLWSIGGSQKTGPKAQRHAKIMTKIMGLISFLFPHTFFFFSPPCDFSGTWIDI